LCFLVTAFIAGNQGELLMKGRVGMGNARNLLWMQMVSRSWIEEVPAISSWKAVKPVLRIAFA